MAMLYALRGYTIGKLFDRTMMTPTIVPPSDLTVKELVAWSHAENKLILDVLEKKVKHLHMEKQLDVAAIARVISRCATLVEAELYSHATSNEQIPVGVRIRNRGLWLGLLRLVDEDPSTYEHTTFREILECFAPLISEGSSDWFATGCAALAHLPALSSNADRFPRKLVDAFFAHAIASEDAERVLLESSKTAWWIKTRYEAYKRDHATAPPGSPERTGTVAPSRQVTPEACARKRTIELRDDPPDAKRRLAL